jgi:hypothetical protein
MASLEELTANLTAGVNRLSKIDTQDQTSAYDARTAAISAALELLGELRGPEEQFLHLSYAVCSRSNPYDSITTNIRGH